jgi:DNA-binding transcriptional ArsR family regulator
MVRIRLSDADVAASRVAFSPLWETLAALLMLRGSDPPWPYREWASAARELLRRPAVAALAPVLGSVPCVPDCLMPAPEHPCESLEDELDRVAHVDARTVREGVLAQFPDGVPADLEAFISSPSRSAGAFADALFTFWESAIAPDWPVMRGLLEREVLVRARSMASSGGEGLFVGLHPQIQWKRPFLELHKPQYQFNRVGDGRGVVIIPLVFGRGGLLFAATPGLQFAISYTPRGVGTIWTAPARRQDGRTRLELLLGDGRAAVLAEIAEPRTTVDVAARLGLAASTVSHHLAVLSEAELVFRRRLGHRVFYELNDTGRALMALLGTPRERLALDSI